MADKIIPYLKSNINNPLSPIVFLTKVLKKLQLSSHFC